MAGCTLTITSLINYKVVLKNKSYLTGQLASCVVLRDLSHAEMIDFAVYVISLVVTSTTISSATENVLVKGCD
jgi:hypothetical protein